MKQQQESISDIYEYAEKQKELILLEYDLETKEKQNMKIPDVDLIFKLKSVAPAGEMRNWSTTLPLPKNLIPPDDLINTDPTYVNVSDKMRVEFLDSDKEPIVGSVEKIRDGELTAIFELDWEEENARHKCSIVFSPNDIVLKRKLNALDDKNKHCIQKLNWRLQEMLCGRYPQTYMHSEMRLYLPSGYNFNESQKEAVRMAVSNPFSLIRGPPGTGKTHTIGAIAIQALHKFRGKKVLVCGTTNVSINSLLEIVGDMLLKEGFKVCWPAASSRDFLKMEDATKEQKLLTLYQSMNLGTSDSEEFKELYNKYKRTYEEEKRMKKLRNSLEEQVIRQSDVVFSTLDSSSKKSIATNIGKISILIVDEATLSVESSMIIPLSLLPDRFVLVGDHKQLGPQWSFDELKENGYYCSIFERIIRERSCLENSVMLNTQYRMHPDISRLPNDLFYRNELIDGVKPEDRQIAPSFVFQKHLNFINFDHPEEESGKSYINHGEMSQVYKFVTSLIDSGVKHSQIGVISAYGAQTKLISDNFRNYGIPVKVSTIDSFQGSQKDYIVICTTRNGPDLGFLKDRRRMNVAITRARCLVAIFGNADTLRFSDYWGKVIKYTEENGSYYTKLPIKIEKVKHKSILISKQGNNIVKEMVSEFKEEISGAGYKLNQIKSPISDSNVRILWPDENDDINFLQDWVDKRINILNNNQYVTLAYDAEGVCMQYGDIFDYNVDYYNWESDNVDFPEIKTNESIIISFYQHKNNFEKDSKLVDIMKPLLEHPKLTLITFDFTFDFDKLYNFGINIKTERIIDIQLMELPEDSPINEKEDFICSTGWKSIGGFILQASEDNVNSNLIIRAKDSVRSNKKQFPHGENNFLIKQFNYPQICQFTNVFLEYSAGDIFYTAIAGVDILSRGELEEVKKRTKSKFESYTKYRKDYDKVSDLRNAYHVCESFTTAISAQFSKDCQTYQILSYHRKLSSFVSILDNHPDLIIKIIPLIKEEDKNTIRKKYNEIIDIMTNPEYPHLGNIKDKAILSYVDGIQKNPSFVLRFKEEIDEVKEIIKEENKVALQKEKEENEAIKKIIGDKIQFRKKDVSAWENVGKDLSKKQVKQAIQPTQKTVKISNKAPISSEKPKDTIGKISKEEVKNDSMNQFTGEKIQFNKHQSAWANVNFDDDITEIKLTIQLVKNSCKAPATYGNHKVGKGKFARPNNTSINNTKQIQQQEKKTVTIPQKSISNATSSESKQMQQKEKPAAISNKPNIAWSNFTLTQNTNMEKAARNAQNPNSNHAKPAPEPVKPAKKVKSLPFEPKLKQTSVANSWKKFGNSQKLI